MSGVSEGGVVRGGRCGVSEGGVEEVWCGEEGV